MQKLTDLRFIIGIFFSLAALVLLFSYFTTEQSNHPQLNLYAGIAMLLFGLLMLLLFYKGDAENA
jgi:cytochrome c biogenesis protein CcdA